MIINRLLPFIPTGLALFVAASAAAADFPVLWVPAANGMVPPNAIIGGREHGLSLPVCRAIYNKGVHPGKVVGSNCNYGYGGREVLSPQYAVLVVGRTPIIPATSAVPGAANPVDVAAEQNQALESTMAAVHAEVLSVAAPSKDVSDSPMQALQAKNNAITALNTQLGELKAAKLKTTDQATLAKLDLQIKDITAQIDNTASSQQLDMVRLQSLLNKRNETFDVMTNFMKKFADKRDAIIGNMR